jgi:hypothetical protein
MITTEISTPSTLHAAPLTIPQAIQTKRAESLNADQQRPRAAPYVLTEADRAAARAKHLADVEEWKKLDLRQAFADEDLMRACLRAAGVRIRSNLEPATPRRVGLLLIRAGVNAQMIRKAIGTGISLYLLKNPRLPLWAAVALILEAASS